jgi:hypothetical protein
MTNHDIVRAVIFGGGAVTAPLMSTNPWMIMLQAALCAFVVGGVYERCIAVGLRQRIADKKPAASE